MDVEPGTCCIGAWGNITLTYWEGRGTAPAVERLARLGAEIRAQYPNGTSAIHLIREGAGMPTSEGRDGLTRLMNTNVDRLACVGVMIGGGGFWSSAIRSMITGMRALSSRAYQLKLVGSIEELVAWLPEPHERRTGIAVDPAELRRALETALTWTSNLPAETDLE